MCLPHFSFYMLTDPPESHWQSQSQSRSLRILIMVTDSRRGGAPRRLADLVRGLRTEGRSTFCLVSLMPIGDVFTQLGTEGFDVRSLNISGPRDIPRGIIQIRRMVREFDPHVIYASLWHASTLARIVGGSHAVVTAHENVDENKSAIRIWSDRLTNRRSVLHTAVSGAVARTVSERDWVGTDRIHVVGIGKDVADWTGHDGGTIRRTFGIPRDARVVGWTGRLYPVKGLNRLIEAMPLLDAWHALIVGDGPELGTLKVMASTLDVSDRVHFLPSVDDVAPYLAAANVYCLPSHWEGLPTALLEAMASGLPVVATPVGGVPELVSHGQNGLLLSKEPSPREIADTILDASGRLELGVAGRETIATRFSTAEIQQKHAEVWELALELKSRSSRKPAS